MQVDFRKANRDDADQIWKIIQQSIERRRLDGSQQWQDGYPSYSSITSDIDRGVGFVLSENDQMAAYAAVILNDEPSYDEIQGKWLTTGDFFVVHRVAVAEDFAGKGYATEIMRKIEDFALSMGVSSIKVDTNFDNPAMLRVFEKLGYIYCGEVFFRGSARMAFEKILKDK